MLPIDYMRQHTASAPRLSSPPTQHEMMLQRTLSSTEDDASMPRITPHPDYWTIWAPSPWPEKNGEPFRVGVYHTRRDAEKAAAQWPNLTCWIVEPAKENQ